MTHRVTLRSQPNIAPPNTPLTPSHSVSYTALDGSTSRDTVARYRAALPG
ncbi:hypothetical protein [Leptothoe sp. PORK10 BA2]|nr:hypothetical protein [Leptothoe sp. PORK10 BA2]MEA5465220.1 hypothetical protein [Leptothoe sp. PORK10 BA2]